MWRSPRGSNAWGGPPRSCRSEAGAAAQLNEEGRLKSALGGRVTLHPLKRVASIPGLGGRVTLHGLKPVATKARGGRDRPRASEGQRHPRPEGLSAAGGEATHPPGGGSGVGVRVRAWVRVVSSGYPCYARCWSEPAPLTAAAIRR